MGFFSKKKQSSSVAKDRLKLVLIHDRANCNTELLEMMKQEIIDVISRYMEIDEKGLEINLGTTSSEYENGIVPALYANIPIRNMRVPGKRT